ncbi:MAG: hypothetical protein WA208_00555 [Thermoanaerobaculia bacterium]
MRFTIESRELTNASTPRPAPGSALRHTTVDARDAHDAIAQYLRDGHLELVSFTRPGGGGESIATVKKEDAVFLVRVYAG